MRGVKLAVRSDFTCSIARSIRTLSKSPLLTRTNRFQTRVCRFIGSFATSVRYAAILMMAKLFGGTRVEVSASDTTWLEGPLNLLEVPLIEDATEQSAALDAVVVVRRGR